MRSKNLDGKDIADIVAILDGWTGPLTWDFLIEIIEKRQFTCYTRQALHRHERIRQAFSMRKAAMTACQSGIDTELETSSPELDAALARMGRLENENTRLIAENGRLIEQFIRWAYNAHTRGLDHHFLNRALPKVDRDQTVVSPVKVRL
jgi:hypothetical protein